MRECSELLLKPCEGGDFEKYILKEEFIYEIDDNLTIKVPKGFKTDLASIPKVFWNILPPFGRYTVASVIHDYLYSSENNTGIDRKGADKIFLDIMKEEGVSSIKRHIMYRGVRLFGGFSWKDKV